MITFPIAPGQRSIHRLNGNDFCTNEGSTITSVVLNIVSGDVIVTNPANDGNVVTLIADAQESSLTTTVVVTLVLANGEVFPFQVCFEMGAE